MPNNIEPNNSEENIEEVVSLDSLMTGGPEDVEENQEGFVTLESLFEEDEGEYTTLESLFEEEKPKEKTFAQSVMDLGSEFVNAAVDGFEAGYNTEDYLEVFGGDFSEDAINRLVEADKQLSSQPQSQTMIEYTKDVEKNGGGFWGSIVALAENPVLAPQVLVQSLAQMAGTVVGGGEETYGTIAAGAGTGAAVGAGTGLLGGPFAEVTVPAGATYGTLYGAMGGLSTAMENGLTFAELLKEEMDEEGKEWNTKSIQKWLNEGDNYTTIRNKALGRGLTIGAIDAITSPIAKGVGGKVAGNLAKQGFSKTTRKVIGGTIDKSIEAIGGSTSEALGQVAAGQDMSETDIILEGVTGIVAPPSIKRLVEKPSYKINGESIDVKTFNDILNTTDDNTLAKLNLEVKNDLEVEQRIQDKVTRARTRSQLDTRVTDEADRDALVDLEIERKKIEKNKTKSAKNQLTFIDSKIKEITDKYEGKEIDPTLQKEKEVVVEEVVGGKLDKSIEFLETQAGERLGKKIYKVKSDKDADGNIIKSADEKAQEIFDKYVEENPGVKPQDVSGGDGFVIGDIVVINEDVAMKTGAVNIGSHETLHFVIDNYLDSYFSKDNKAFKNKSDAEILNARKKLINDFKSKLSKKDLQLLDERRKLYEKTVKDFDPETSTEWFTWFSDAIENGDITFNENLFTNIRDFVNNILTSVGIRKEFSTADQAYRFMKDYSKNVSEGKLGKRALKVAEAKPKVEAKPKAEKELVFSKTETVDVKGMDSKQVQTMVDKVANRAWTKFGNPIPANIKQKAGVTRQSYIESAKTELAGIAKEFDPTKKDKDGNPIDFDRFMANRGMQRMNSLASRLGVESAEKPTSKRLGQAVQEGEKEFDIKSQDPTPEEVMISKEDESKARKGIKLADRLGDDAKKISEKVKKMKPVLEGKTYKTLKDLAPDDTQRMFGIKPKPGNLTKEDVKNAQQFINKNADILLAMLPEGTTVSGKATGVQKVLLDPFYNKGRRVKAAKTGSTAGLATQNKKPNIKISEFKEVFGITPAGQPNISDRNTSARIKALVDQTGKLLTNQAIREVTPDAPTEITEGKSRVMFSKTLNGETQYNATVDEINDATARGDDFKFSEVEEPISVPNLNPEQVEQVADFLENVTESFDKDIRDTDAYIDLYAEVLDQDVKDFLEVSGIKDMFSKAQAYKKPLLNKNWKSANKQKQKYLDNITNKSNKVAMEELAETVSEMIDILPPIVLKNLSPDLLGLISGGRLLDIAVKRQDTNYRKLLEKYNAKVDSIKDVKAETQRFIDKHGFDPGNVEIMNANFGLFNDIQRILAKKMPAKQKQQEIKEKLGARITKANNVNPKMYKYLVQEFAKAIDKNPNALVGIARLLEGNTNNVKGFRGLTTLSLIEFDNNSQAPYFDPNTGKFAFTKGEALKRNIPINKDHYLYKEAVKATNETVAAWSQNQALKGEKITSEKLQEVYDSQLGERLRFKGEHVDPQANVSTGVMQSLVDYYNNIKEGMNPDLAKSKLNNRVEELLKNYDQTLGAEVLSFMQDKKLGTTSKLAFLRNVVTPKDKMRKWKTVDGLDSQQFTRKKIEEQDRINKLRSKKQAVNKKVNIPLVDDAKVMNTKFSKSMTSEYVINKAASLDEALRNARDPKAPIKKIRVFDFDDTLARTKSNVLYTMLDGETGKLTAEEFAKKGDELLAEGADFDFSEFNKVMDGKKGPLFEVAKKIQEARGTDDVFVLTARAPEASTAIKEFLDAIGLNIPLKNITGLGDSSPYAKSNWIVDKAAEGYNDFYFADDAIQNVKAVSDAMSVLDVKAKTQLAKQNNLKFSKSLGKKLSWKTDEVGNMTSKFKIKDKSYNVKLEPVDSKGDYRYEFELETKTGPTQAITGTGDAIPVFSTVYKGLVDAINDNSKIKRVEFSADKAEPSRVRVYTSLMNKLSKDLGWDNDIWETTDWEDGGSFDFEITKPRKKQSAPVEKVLNVIDIKSETQKAKIKFSKTLNEDFNNIIEESTGIDKFKIYSDIKAEIRGAKARKQRFFIPPSAEDFRGLLYTTLPKGVKGEKALAFYKKSLLDPYSKAMENLSTDRINLMNDFKALKKELDVPKDLQKQTESGFTNEQAVRVYLWNKIGEDIPGLSKSDLKELNDIVENNPKLKVFADQILAITKGDGYSTPTRNWATGTITTDLIDVLNTTKRSKYLETWKQNVDIIFSKDNLNKLEAAFGKSYREAVENSLSRMKSGSNRVAGGNKLSNQILDYINNSTAVTMFMNTRSAILQTISAANFINWSFNSPYHAGKAFANQPQYWKDFIKLMNSDYLVDRRNGLKLNINESEIANAAKTSKNKAKAALNYILEKGYLPTKFADSFAIASGGATWYRNKIKDLMKDGLLTEKEAEAQAMKEFRDISEMSQQSSDPSKISSQQSSDLGRIILQYVNTPMQYARLQKRDIQDTVNGRRMPGKTLAQSNRVRASRIAYYMFLQNLAFNALQQGLFAIGFGDDEIDEKEEEKLFDAANGMLDSSLRGLGLAGVTIQVIKNLGIDIYDRSKRKRPEYSDSWIKLLEFSPAIKTKLSKLRSAAWPFDSRKRRAEVFEKGFSLDNPAYESMAKVISATSNVPLDRLYGKINNIKAALSDEAEAWQSLAMVLGWPEWQIMDDEKPKSKSKSKSSSKGGYKRKTYKRKTYKR